MNLTDSSVGSGIIPFDLCLKVTLSIKLLNLSLNDPTTLSGESTD